MEELINIEFTCPICGKTHYLHNVPKSLVERFQNRHATGEHVQDIFKGYSPVDREKFLTGYCDECQKLIFGVGV